MSTSLDRPRRLDLRADPERELADVADHLRAGGVVGYPTETVYGLGSTLDERGLARLRTLKRRDAAKPFIALVPSRDDAMAARLTWTDEARELADIFWPGAVTLVLADPSGAFPIGVRSEEAGAVGVRVSPHPVVTRLLAELGEPLTSTSLNLPGEAPALAGDEAARVVQRLGGDDVWVLDAGTLPPSGPSTVIDCTHDTPVVLREGTVPVSRLRCAIPEIHERPS